MLPVSVAADAVGRHRIADDNALRRVCRQFGHHLAMHLHPVGVAVGNGVPPYQRHVCRRGTGQHRALQRDEALRRGLEECLFRIGAVAVGLTPRPDDRAALGQVLGDLRREERLHAQAVGPELPRRRLGTIVRIGDERTWIDRGPDARHVIDAVARNHRPVGGSVRGEHVVGQRSEMPRHALRQHVRCAIGQRIVERVRLAGDEQHHPLARAALPACRACEQRRDVGR